MAGTGLWSLPHILCFSPHLEQGASPARDARREACFPSLECVFLQGLVGPSLVCLYVHHVERGCVQAGMRLGFVWVACGRWCEWEYWTASSTFPGWRAVRLGATFPKGPSSSFILELERRPGTCPQLQDELETDAGQGGASPDSSDPFLLCRGPRPLPPTQKGNITIIRDLRLKGSSEA